MLPLQSIFGCTAPNSDGSLCLSMSKKAKAGQTIGVNLRTCNFLVFVSDDSKTSCTVSDVNKFCADEFVVVDNNPFHLKVGAILRLKEVDSMPEVGALTIDDDKLVHVIKMQVDDDGEKQSHKKRKVVRRVVVGGITTSREQTIEIFLVWCDYHNNLLASSYGQEKLVYAKNVQSYRTASTGSLRNFFRYDVGSKKIKPCANASEAIEAMEFFTKLSFFDDINQNSASYDIDHILKNADDESKLPIVDVANC